LPLAHGVPSSREFRLKGKGDERPVKYGIPIRSFRKIDSFSGYDSRRVVESPRRLFAHRLYGMIDNASIVDNKCGQFGGKCDSV